MNIEDHQLFAIHYWELKTMRLIKDDFLADDMTLDQIPDEVEGGQTAEHSSETWATPFVMFAMESIATSSHPPHLFRVQRRASGLPLCESR